MCATIEVVKRLQRESKTAGMNASFTAKGFAKTQQQAKSPTMPSAAPVFTSMRMMAEKYACCQARRPRAAAKLAQTIVRNNYGNTGIHKRGKMP